MLEAPRLSLRDNRAYLWCLFAGLAKLHLGNEEEVGRVAATSTAVSNCETAQGFV